MLEAAMVVKVNVQRNGIGMHVELHAPQVVSGATHDLRIVSACLIEKDLRSRYAQGCPNTPSARQIVISCCNLE